ncbi:MAG: heavy-metal-associated domain-containing protein [Flavisolibacter sp.]
MKKLLCFLIIGFVTVTSVSAQTKAVQTVKFTTPTVQCDMCKNTIETFMKRIDGVLLVNVNVRHKETTIKYLTDRTNEEYLKTAIVNAGYDANELKANPEAYKALPKCCKKPEDGGGMPKH